MYDVIGDIHGHADELAALLERLGYRRRDGHYAHPTRRAVFVGDFIDRGPKIARVLQTVRPMVEAGSGLAVIGNHEFNALAYHTRSTAGDGYLRPHTEKNVKQHAQTLRQLSDGGLDDALEWFRALPWWLELDGIRVVHACWDAASLGVIQAALAEHGGVTDAFLHAATARGEPLFAAVEDVLKGKELPLPEGCSFLDKSGHRRTRVRIRWFEQPDGRTFAQYALPAAAALPQQPVPPEAAGGITPYDASHPPVFIGHYWLRDPRPARLAANVACVDYSVAKCGSLCAYRWNGEAELSDENFVWVDAGSSA